jgi:hypothetical protein
MSTITIAGTVTDQAGAKGTFSIVVSTDTVTVTPTVSPQVAPPGTVRTLTLVATSSSGSPLIFSAPVVPGLTFTPVAGQVNSWTFVF